jgi:hypothetical protein
MPPQAVYSPMTALSLKASGLTVAETAREMGCHRDTVYRLLAMARAAEASDLTEHDLTPMGAGVFYKCMHRERPMLPGEPFVCLECQQSGIDWLARMKAVPLPRDRKKYRPGKLKGGVK